MVESFCTLTVPSWNLTPKSALGKNHWISSKYIQFKYPGLILYRNAFHFDFEKVLRGLPQLRFETEKKRSHWLENICKWKVDNHVHVRTEWCVFAVGLSETVWKDFSEIFQRMPTRIPRRPCLEAVIVIQCLDLLSWCCCVHWTPLPLFVISSVAP